MSISILGCGWFGGALGRHLAGRGYVVKGSTRDGRNGTYAVDVHEPIDPDLLDCEVLVVRWGAEVGRLPESDLYQFDRVVWRWRSG